jgi:asparaginyl-tRNA synthetase
MRVRSALARATHEFFSQNGFLYIHTPIISASDCEGAGEMLQVGFGRISLLLWCCLPSSPVVVSFSCQVHKAHVKACLCE